MKLTKSSGDLSDPGSAAWAEAGRESVRLAPMPLDAQPTEYIRTAWADRPYGQIAEVTVSAAQDGKRAYIRLEWADSEVPNTEFQDAAAVYFPTEEGASAATIGSESSPVRLWFWQSKLPAPKALIGSGPGRFRPDSNNGVTASASLEGGKWSVVLGASIDDVSAGRVGVAVWDGSNDERAGIGAATPEWITLETTS